MAFLQYTFLRSMGYFPVFQQIDNDFLEFTEYFLAILKN